MCLELTPWVSRECHPVNLTLINPLPSSAIPASPALERCLLAAAAAALGAEPPPPAVAQLRRVRRLGRILLQRRVRARLGAPRILRLPTSTRLAGADILMALRCVLPGYSMF